MNLCVAAGAFKAAILLAGSATEAMLLDALGRNRAVTKTYFPKVDFPDKWSLGQLVEAAVAEGLLTSTAAHLAPAVRDYRDLIHPHRVRTTDIKVHVETAKLWVQAAVVIAKELAGGVDGRLAAFQSKA